MNMKRALGTTGGANLFAVSVEARLSTMGGPATAASISRSLARDIHCYQSFSVSPEDSAYAAALAAITSAKSAAALAG